MSGFSADMGDHAIYVWPAYAAFAAIFIGLFVWARMASAREKARLAKLETARSETRWAIKALARARGATPRPAPG